MTRILFVNPLTLPLDLLEASLANVTPGMQNLAQEGISLPMGIMYLSSYLKHRIPSIQIELLDYRIQYDKLQQYDSVDAFIRDIAVDNITAPPDIIAFSVVVSSSHLFFLKSLKITKKLWPTATIIVGGFHATNFTSELLEHKEIDYIFRGEAEYALFDFVKQFPAINLAELPGVVSRINRFFNPMPKCKPLVSMDENPLPDYDLPDMAQYIRGNTRMVIKQTSDKQVFSANIMTSLGCPFECTFCASRTVHGRKMRYKSVENVVNEVRLLHEKYGVTLIMPEDDLFTANKKRTLQLLAALRKLEIPGFRMQFPVALSVNTLSYELIDALVESGMDVASLAIESGSEHVQNNIINKGVDLAKARQWVAYLRGKKIPVRCSFILGFPGETKAQMNESIEFAAGLGADWYDFFVATPLAGSEMCQQFIDQGHIPDDIDSISRGYYSRRTFDTPEISATDLIDLVYKANLICNFVSNTNIRNGRWEEGVRLFEPITMKYPFHLIAHDCLRLCLSALKRHDDANRIIQASISSLATDERAREMAKKFGNLLSPEFSSQLHLH